jgi:antitoxin VapB
MAFHVRDLETDSLVRELALKRGLGLTEANKLAVSTVLKANEADRAARLAKMQETQDRIAARPDTGLRADKAFFYALSGG